MGFDAPQPGSFSRFHRPQPEPEKKPAEKKARKGYRLNLKFPDHYRDYLQEMAWRNRTNVTAYLSELIEEDMRKHPDWQDGVDELNG